MKIVLSEYDGYFSLYATAETVQDAALLVRLGVNWKNEIQHCSANASGAGEVTASLVVSKRKQQQSEIPKA